LRKENEWVLTREELEEKVMDAGDIVGKEVMVILDVDKTDVIW
jgi:hypothetical protein